MDRAQAFTLEAFVAALLLLGSVGFALDATSVTTTASSADERAEGQLAAIAGGALDRAAANGSLRPTFLSWDETEERFHGASGANYVADEPPTKLGDRLERSLVDRGFAYNLAVRYVDETGTSHEQRLVHYGTPSDDAVRVVATITLYDDDRLVGPDGSPTSTTLASASQFYAPDAAPDGPVYNVVHVEVVAWRA